MIYSVTITASNEIKSFAEVKTTFLNFHYETHRTGEKRKNHDSYDHLYKKRLKIKKQNIPTGQDHAATSHYTKEQQEKLKTMTKEDKERARYRRKYFHQAKVCKNLSR